MEGSTDLTLGQSEWWIKELVKKGVIKKTRKKTPNKIGKGKPQCRLSVGMRKPDSPHKTHTARVD